MERRDLHRVDPVGRHVPADGERLFGRHDKVRVLRLALVRSVGVGPRLEHADAVDRDARGGREVRVVGEADPEVFLLGQRDHGEPAVGPGRDRFVVDEDLDRVRARLFRVVAFGPDLSVAADDDRLLLLDDFDDLLGRLVGRRRADDVERPPQDADGWLHSRHLALKGSLDFFPVLDGQDDLQPGSFRLAVADGNEGFFVSHGDEPHRSFRRVELDFDFVQFEQLADAVAKLAFAAGGRAPLSRLDFDRHLVRAVFVLEKDGQFPDRVGESLVIRVVGRRLGGRRETAQRGHEEEHSEAGTGCGHEFHSRIHVL